MGTSPFVATHSAESRAARAPRYQVRSVTTRGCVPTEKPARLGTTGSRIPRDRSGDRSVSRNTRTEAAPANREPKAPHRRYQVTRKLLERADLTRASSRTDLRLAIAGHICQYVARNRDGPRCGPTQGEPTVREQNNALVCRVMLPGDPRSSGCGWMPPSRDLPRLPPTWCCDAAEVCGRVPCRDWLNIAASTCTTFCWRSPRTSAAGRPKHEACADMSISPPASSPASSPRPPRCPAAGPQRRQPSRTLCQAPPAAGRGLPVSLPDR